MPNIKGLTGGDAEKLEIQVEGGVAHVTLSPGRMTGTAIVAIGEEDNEAKQYKIVAEVLSECITEWDITDTDEAGKEITLPITAENILLFPVSFVTEMFEKAQELSNPQKTNGGSFGNG